MNKYSLAWEAGPTAQLELFSPGKNPGQNDSADYRLKYTPALRQTLRPPLKDLRLGRGELAPIMERLNKLVGTLDARGGAAAAGATPDDSVLDLAKNVGELLFQLVIPGDVEIDLSADTVFLEIGLDEELLDYPWELLFDGREFLCLKHAVGRFVNVSDPQPTPAKAPAAAPNSPISVLVISVPNPQPRTPDGVAQVYECLPEAEAETSAIINMLTGTGIEATPFVLAGHDATWDNVANAIRHPNRYHIIHYCGHAFFNPSRPYESALVLQDKNMSTGHIRGMCSRQPPVLFFMNGCETAASRPSSEWKDRYNIFGLARAFLETGAFLLGNRWKVGDAAAAAFAQAFYRGILEGLPFGNAVRDARRACRDQAHNDLSWASYTFYGDPRLCFKQALQQQEAQ
jgi:CHAT domain-containing protein